LSPSYLVPSSIFDILPPVRIRRQGIRLELESERKLLVEVEDLLIVVFEVLIPNATHLTEIPQAILLLRLLALSVEKFGHEFRFYFPNTAFKVVRRLLLLAHREEAPFAGIEGQLEHDITVSYPIMR
jgi:hypothetical protein